MTGSSFERLLYRRQFLVAPEPISGLTDWQRADVAGRYHVAAHPDVELCQVVEGQRSVTLIGFILDPDNPEHSNTHVLRGLLDRTGGALDVIAATSRLGGRWVLVVSDRDQVLVFGDAGGQRQVAYGRGGSASATPGWCASQPGAIAERLELHEDPDAAAFLRARQTWDYMVRWFPGDLTLYAEVAMLLPNHYLDLASGVAHRYWPVAALTPLSHDEALEESGRLLRGLMTAARRRFSLAISMTAGWDSRLMLALSKDVYKDLYYFTLRYPDFDHDAPDIVVPRSLLKKLGVTYNVIDCTGEVDRAFETVCERSVAELHGGCGDVWALHEEYPQERVCLSGDLGEVFKCFFEPDVGPDGRVTAGALAQFDSMAEEPLAVAAHERWLAGIPPATIDVRELFSWEQLGGRIQSVYRAGYDLVQESFAPFNCRSLLVALLSLDRSFRVRPQCLIMHDLIDAAWPELLSEPVNPPRRVGRAQALVRVLVKWNIWQQVPQPLVRLGKRAMGRPVAERSHVQ